ncbi:MAG: hypothetical protein AB7U81_00795 [Thiohalomonadaceae bacterium]
MSGRALLAVVELGGYPNLEPLYTRLGFAVTTVQAGRKALAAVKAVRPAVVVAEFNYQRDFRDRTSSLESLLAALQKQADTRILVFHEPGDAAPLAQLRARFPGFTALPRPITEAAVEAWLCGGDV